MNILITGSSSGIGLRLAWDYLEEGHTLYCCGRNTTQLQKLKAEYGEQLHILSFNVADLDQCRQALVQLPELDLVILNAGTCEYIDVGQFSAESFERVFRINVLGVSNCLEQLLPRLKPGSSLALMGSSSSYLPLPRAEAYGASKAAVEYLARTLGITLGKRHILVSYIAPGFVETPLTDRNDFPMPLRVDVEFASRRIRKGLRKRKREIHFPRLFTLVLKTLALLPNGLQRLLIAKALTN